AAKSGSGFGGPHDGCPTGRTKFHSGLPSTFVGAIGIGLELSLCDDDVGVSKIHRDTKRTAGAALTVRAMAYAGQGWIGNSDRSIPDRATHPPTFMYVRHLGPSC